MYMKLLELRDKLRTGQQLLVLAESCTCGLVASELGQIPGISAVFCGSMVVYRNDSKCRWLGIDSELLESPSVGPVSETVTVQLARSVLQRTPEATLSGAVTGHLGPDSPVAMDGVVYFAVVKTDVPGGPIAIARRIHLSSPAPRNAEDSSRRVARQREAAERMLDFLNEFVS